ncbi:MAG: response regulator [Sphingomonas sp.]|uniref:response regulator n=1 Tax=Sphingomonas sp. TaxID=28214 RepID=UPI001B08D888|nr:response regulator [Sphingomonas sp.]MBO9622675.1 response regulator [Sphingomonas sp.]
MHSLLAAFWNDGLAPDASMGLVWTHAVADAVSALSYVAIAVALFVLVRRRTELSYGWAFWCFAAFLAVCGLAHAVNILGLWHPAFGLQAVVKLVGAAVSLAAAIALWLLLPKAFTLPSAAELHAANRELEERVRERDAALGDLRAQAAQREHAEAALLQSQKLEAVGQLTGGIAHDFNNLLQAIAGNLELIARKPDDGDRVVRWSASALNAVERGRALTGQLLAFSRKQRLDMASVRLVELIGGVKDLVERAVAPLSHVQIKPIDPALNVEADPLQVELAVLNLAFNARDAMPEGGTLTISAERRSGQVAPDLAPGDYVALTLRDTGTGMSPEVLARAAEPFFTTKGVGKGTGMGLSMAYGVMRECGGGLQIESEQGKGTAVTLFLRVARVEPRRAVEDDARSDQRIDLSDCRITLIEDDPEVRTTLVEMLRAAGAEVREAGDGAEGLELIRARKPDLVIVDFAMPGMSGADVAREVRQTDPDLDVLVVTGFAESSQLEALAGPHLQMLKKPFESHELLRRVADILDR